tara:strand:- start:49 stop:477 length:429 start_codon:yes stop_codon:yes gene_type:complete
MSIQIFPRNLLNFINVPIFVFLTILEPNIINKEIKAETNLLPATEKDLYLYKGMGASYLCIASKAGIEFPKAVGVATATYVQVLEGKHGGLIKDLSDKKLDREKLYSGAEFQIVTTAIQYCPDSVPKKVTKKVNKILKENKK